ncbi:MAG: replication protein RepA [Alteromonadaceae bacterium]|nr:replication protein RepA [Alteromonadaceae bacterium]|tara:strand:- start:3617 stop:3919 length:303 start_codon:yes stop_codon:yes gene_type:complete
MSLINLSRSTPLASRTTTKKVSAEEFIQDALHYASGTVVPLAAVTDRQVNDSHHEPMRRATFTLTPECIDQLQQLSEQSGIAKSKLIRLWIQRYASLNFD